MSSALQLEEAALKAPTSPQANFMASREFQAAGKLDVALDYAFKAIEWGHKQSDPEKHSFYYVNAARILVKFRHMKAADAICRHALSIGLGTVGTYKGIAEVNVASKQYDVALQSIDLALSLDPNNESLRQFRKQVEALAT